MAVHGDGSQEGRWSNLADDILSDIYLRSVSAYDGARFAAVCSSWRAAVAWHPRLPTLPLLLLSTGDGERDRQARAYSPEDGRALRVPLPWFPWGNRLVGSYEGGWIAAVSGSDGLLVVNIFSGVRAARLDIDMFFIRKIVFSKDPSSDGSVMAAMNSRCTVALRRVGCPNPSWTRSTINTYMGLILLDIAFCNGELVGVTFEELLVFHIGVNEEGALGGILVFRVDVDMRSFYIMELSSTVKYVFELHGKLAIAVELNGDFFRVFELADNGTTTSHKYAWVESISTRPPDEAPERRFSHPDGEIRPVAPRFLVFVRIWPFIHPASPRHPRPPGRDSGRVKSGEGPDLSVTRHTNPTATPRISLAVGTTPPACCPDSAVPPSPPAYIPPSFDDNLFGCSSAGLFSDFAPRRSRLGLPRPRPSGVRPFASPAMDSDEEEEQMFVELMQEEMAAADQDDEHMMILGCLASMYAGLATGRRGGSAPGRRKCKPRQRMEGYCMLYADYFADNPLHDVERAFGVLQQRFAVVRFPAMTWSKDQMWEVMNCCVCLHNMIIENERKHPVPLAEQEAPYEREGPLAQPNHQVPPSWAAFIAMRQEIRDSTMHQLLQDDLVEHIWRLRGNANADAN
ncbi:hypothetical protein QYE76_023983 [Lolium multiflorum]|uniref:KIB1-4 beta-propeller domain-containing protein n=1 Tax=Lolium multiflorum TaxID=4521 RepID=A0AAD8RCU1_LOLMU|nr:hypothetical protein QYE76_023983 [Lolium multiflorum]